MVQPSPVDRVAATPESISRWTSSESSPRSASTSIVSAPGAGTPRRTEAGVSVSVTG